MKIDTKVCKKVNTTGHKNIKNGWILELNSDRDKWTEFIKGQVYLTVVNPKKQKGFHLHKLKINHITCIKGRVTVGVFNGKKVQEFNIGEDNFLSIKIPPKKPFAIFNRGRIDAYVINYSYPSYNPKVREQREVEITWTPNDN